MDVHQNYHKETLVNIINLVKFNPHITLREFQTSLTASGVNAYVPPIRLKLNGYSIHWNIARKKPLLSMKKKAACLKFVREKLNKPKALLKSILWRDWVKLFHQNQNCYLWRKVNTAYQAKNIVPMEKHSGRNVKIRDCFFLHLNLNDYLYEPWKN